MQRLKADWPYPRLIAHRGGGTLAPENTLAAMRTGHELGYQGVEFDVKLSADKVSILMHDPTLARTTNGQGEVKHLHFEQLNKVDAGSWHSARFAGERIPRFADVAAYLVENGMVANVEIKPCPGVEEATGGQIASECLQFWAGQAVQPLLSSFSFASLLAAKAAAPELGRGLLVKDFEEAHWEALEALEAVSFHCHHGRVERPLVDAMHARGYRVMTYTVNDVGRVAELVAMGVDGIFTDSLDAMREAYPGLIGKNNRAN